MTVAQSMHNFFSSVFWLLPPFLVALTVHEFSHAWSSTLLGDTTARRRGRLTLNPLKHIDPIGLLCLFIFRIGWAKPVPFNPLNFKYPRFYSVLTAFAGPFSNFVLAWVSFSVLHHLGSPHGYLFAFFQLSAYINTMLGVFNLIPLPPLDGSHLLDALLVMHYPHIIIWLRRYALFIILFLFYLPPFRIGLMNAIQTVQYFIEMIAL